MTFGPRRCSNPARRSNRSVLTTRPRRAFGAAQTTRDAIAARGRRATGSAPLAVGGELEPHARPVVAVDAPAHGERVDEMQSEAACPETGGTREDRAVTAVLD